MSRGLQTTIDNYVPLCYIDTEPQHRQAVAVQGRPLRKGVGASRAAGLSLFFGTEDARGACCRPCT